MGCSGDPASILIVEPDATVREILRLRLGLAGRRSRAVRTVAEAYDALAQARPGLVIIEAQRGAPEVLGLVQDLQSRPDPRPAVLVTGRHLSKSLLSRLLALGVQECLLKPFAATDMLARAERLLRANQSQHPPPGPVYID